jgi:hypothetical protein
MMAGGMVKPRKLAGAPEWVFRWTAGKRPLLPKLFAVVLVGAAFAFFITSARIRVTALEKSTPRKASVIYLREDAEGRALTLRAREGGPFPSRFEPSQWEGMAALESSALDAVRFQPPPYVPALADLPAGNLVQNVELAAKGQSFFPKRNPPSAHPQEHPKLKLAPLLYPLSGISAATLPEALPPFAAAVDGAMSSASWRFLVRLNPDGGVAECVSLEKGGEPGAPELEAWLHKIPFKPELAKPFRWIAVGIGFTNQPVADGPDAR